MDHLSPHNILNLPMGKDRDRERERERERESRRVGEEEWCDGIPLPLGDLKKHRYETGRKITNGDRKRD